MEEHPGSRMAEERQGGRGGRGVESQAGVWKGPGEGEGAVRSLGDQLTDKYLIRTFANLHLASAPSSPPPPRL